jgi:AcrR family transcriptional regulator
MVATTSAGHRERLLETAIVCLREQGYARTTARDLVAASGTNLASIGYHFGSKERLLNAALTEAFRRWLKPFVAVAAEPGPETPLERLGKVIDSILATVEENRGLISAAFEAWAQVTRSDELRADLAATYDEFRDAIAGAVRAAFADAPQAERIDARTLATVMIATFDGLLVQWEVDPEEVPSSAQLTDVAAGLIAALGQRS